MYFLLHPLSFWDWTRDQKIQTLILTILLFTLGWAVFVEIPKMRRRLTLLSHSLEEGSQFRNFSTPQQVEEKWSRIVFAFSNTSRRPIKPISLNVTTYNSGTIPTGKYWNGVVEELSEGNHHAGQFNFDGSFKKDDLRTITIKDSMNKIHTFYFHEWKQQNWLVGRFWIFFDWYFKKLGL